MTSRTVFQAFAEAVQKDRPVALATVLASDAETHPVGAKALMDRSGTVLEGTLGSDELEKLAGERTRTLFAERSSGTLQVEGTRVFLEVHLPPPRLVIVGAVHIAITLGRIARELGFRVVVCDARDRFATPDRFPDADELILGWPNEVLPRLALDEFSHVVVITHDAKFDNPALIAALESPAPYVGALGSSRTHARRVEALREAGVSEADIARIHAPIGLDIGARTPQEIALATMAEIVAVRNQAVPGDGSS